MSKTDPPQSSRKSVHRKFSRQKNAPNVPRRKNKTLSAWSMFFLVCLPCTICSAYAAQMSDKQTLAFCVRPLNAALACALAFADFFHRYKSKPPRHLRLRAKEDILSLTDILGFYESPPLGIDRNTGKDFTRSKTLHSSPQTAKQGRRKPRRTEKSFQIDELNRNAPRILIDKSIRTPLISPPRNK